MSSSGAKKGAKIETVMPKPRHVPSERPGPSGGKRDANRRAKTEALCRAGLDLFLARGIEAVTIDDLAKGAGVAKGSFYRYFKDKRDLVDALIEPLRADMAAAFDRCVEAVSEADQESLSSAYIGVARDLGRVLITRPDFVRLYLQENRAPGIGARGPVAALDQLVTERAMTLTTIAHGAGLLETKNPHVTAIGVVGATERLVHAYLGGEMDGDVASLAMVLINMVMNGLRPKG